MRIRHFLIALLVGTAMAQSRPDTTPDSAHAEVTPLPNTTQPQPAAAVVSSYKTDAVLVNVDVLVTDDSGRVITGLNKENFRVFDNGILQEISHFSPASEPITIVLLMEYSAVSSNYFALKAADWGTGFLSHLAPTDWIALTTFDLNPKVRTDFTHNQYEVRGAIASLGTPEFTEANLYDALIETLDQLENVRGRTSILLFATGVNTFSAATFDDVRERLRHTDTVLFCVGLAEGEFIRYGGDITYLQGKNALTSFAKQTGGLALFPRFEGELPEIFRSVVGYLRSEYTLSFRPAADRHDGQFHRLRIEIVDSDGKPLKVRDEKGKMRKVEVNAREGYVAAKE